MVIRIFLLLVLSSIFVHSQQLPQEPKDPVILENEEFLYKKINDAAFQLSNLLHHTSGNSTSRYPGNILLKRDSTYYLISVDDNGVLQIDETSATTSDTYFYLSANTLYKNYIDTNGVLDCDNLNVVLYVPQYYLLSPSSKIYRFYIDNNGVYNLDYIGG